MRINNPNDPIYYVYAWYFTDTDEIFHIGKGKGNRCYDTKGHRNQYFINTIKKYPDRVAVKFLLTGLTNDEALSKERELIAHYKSIGQCKTNLHEGGCGGYTGNYYSPERIRKLSIAGKRLVGQKNPMYGRHHTKEAREKMSKANLGKKLSPEHIEKLCKANTGRVKTPEELMKISIGNKGKIVAKESIVKGIKTQTDHVYEISYDNKLFVKCLGNKTNAAFCKKELRISISILGKIISNTFTPKFNRHKWISKLEIKQIKKQDCQDIDSCFIDSPTIIVDQYVFDQVKKIIKDEKDKADILRYGEINPTVRK